MAKKKNESTIFTEEQAAQNGQVQEHSIEEQMEIERQKNEQAKRDNLLAKGMNQVQNITFTASRASTVLTGAMNGNLQAKDLINFACPTVRSFGYAVQGVQGLTGKESKAASNDAELSMKMGGADSTRQAKARPGANTKVLTNENIVYYNKNQKAPMTADQTKIRQLTMEGKSEQYLAAYEGKLENANLNVAVQNNSQYMTGYDLGDDFFNEFSDETKESAANMVEHYTEQSANAGDPAGVLKEAKGAAVQGRDISALDSTLAGIQANTPTAGDIAYGLG